MPLLGEARALRPGLGNTDPVAVVGALLVGGPLRAESVGVASESLATAVLILGRLGFREVGAGMVDIICSIWASAAEVVSARWASEGAEGFWMRIREAGVAGALVFEAAD